MATIEDELRRFLMGVRGTVCFPDKTRIYAPTCYGECIDEVNKLIEEVNKLFGGSTVYDAVGSWYNEEKGIIETEPVKVIESAHNCLTKEGAERLMKAITNYGRRANQTAISVENGNQFYIARTEDLLQALKRKELVVL